MEKKLNKLGNIIYYIFNFATMPFLICWCMFNIFGYNEIMLDDETINGIYLFLCGSLTLLYWRLLFVIGEIFDHQTKFGLDFFKYKKMYRKQLNLLPEYNDSVESVGLYTLFKKYCLDETIYINHNKREVDQTQFNIEKLSQINTNCLLGFNSTFIGRSNAKSSFGGEYGMGYKIKLDENPPLYMFPVNSRFYVKFPKFGICKKWEELYNKVIDELKDIYEINTHTTNYDSNGVRKNETNIVEYAISMGNIVEFISYKQHDELMMLHKKAQKNHNKYILNKRLTQK